jgi:membrane protease YdiL (CAAX protease family)
MNSRIITGYLSVLALSFFLHAMKPGSAYFSLLPLLMLIFPFTVGHRVKLTFSLQDFSLGLVVSLVLLLPYYLLFGGTGKTITLYALIFQILAVSFPEEFFFRGFLQDSIGKSFRAVFWVSLLFSLAHLPKAIFTGEWVSLLSFFPSLIMGWLYMKTNNILPGVLFHFLANLAYHN